MIHGLLVFLTLASPRAGAQWDALASLSSLIVRQKSELQTAGPERRAAISRGIERNLGRIESIGASAPDDLDAQLAVTQALLDAREPLRALKASERALLLDPSSPQALSLHAMANYDAGRLEQAVADATKALNFDGGNQAAQAVLRLADGRGQARAPSQEAALPVAAALQPLSAQDEARQRLMFEKGARSAERSRVESLVDQAASSLKLGDRAQSRALLERALEQEPGNGRLRALLALTLLAPGADAAAAAAAAALAQARRAVALSPKNAMAQAALGRALEATGGSPDDILGAFRAAAALDPALEPAYRDALARRQAGAPMTSDGAPGPGAEGASGAVHDLLFNRLPEAARKGWPWLSVAAGAAFLFWTLRSKRRVS